MDCLQRELQHDDEYAMRQRREHTQEVVALFCNSTPHPEVKKLTKKDLFCSQLFQNQRLRNVLTVSDLCTREKSMARTPVNEKKLLFKPL